jgi:periplasmic protein TonB
MKATKSKLKIMNTGPEVSEEEIHAFMDFEQLLKRRSGIAKRKKRIAFLKKGLIVSGAIITLSAVWLSHRGSSGHDPAGQEKNMLTPSSQAGSPGADSAAIHKDLNISPDANGSDNTLEKRPASDNDPSGTDKGTPKNRRLESMNPVTTAPQPGSPEASTSSEYQFVEAEPLDGYPSLYEYFSRELIYPEAAIKDSVQGVVTVSFVVGITGTAEKIRIEHPLGDAFDREAVRLVENMPAWKPATLNGDPIPTKLSMPVTFQIRRIKID